MGIICGRSIRILPVEKSVDKCGMGGVLLVGLAVEKWEEWSCMGDVGDNDGGTNIRCVIWWLRWVDADCFDE